MITVSDTVLDKTGSPAVGTISFARSAQMYDTATNTVYDRQPEVVDLAADGSFSIELPATTDASTRPTGVTYLVKLKIDPNIEDSFSIALDHTLGATQHLSQIAPVTNQTLIQYASVAAVNSHIAASTNVHGILNTAQLATLADLASKADTAAAETITGQWDFTSGRLTVPQTSGRPASSPPAGTLAYDAAARVLWLRGGSDWYTTTLALAWLDGWSYARPLTVTNDGATTLANYQTKISLTSANMSFANANADGSDLRVTLADGRTLVDHYISAWDAVGQTATVWVKLPTLPTTGATLYVYYGNAGATSTTVTFDAMFAKFATDASTLALWHCDDGTGTSAADGSGNSLPLTLTNVTWGASDGGGQDTTQSHFSTGSYLVFNGTNAYASQATVLSTLPQVYTVEQWIRLDAAPSGNQVIWAHAADTVSPTAHTTCYVLGTGAMQISVAQMNGVTQTGISPVLSWTVGQWYHVATTIGEGGARVYRNGTLVTALPFADTIPTSAPSAFVLGANYAHSGAWFKGAMDEVRILSTESTPLEIVNDWQRTTRFSAAMDQPSRWVRHTTSAPVLQASVAWESGSTTEQTVIHRTGQPYQMWYRAGTGANQAVGYATSNDGVTWTKYAGNPVLGIGGSGVSGTVTHPIVWWDGTQYVMYAATTQEIANSGGGFSAYTSPDGITWTPYAGNPVLTLSNSGWETAAGNAWVFSHAGTWYLLYEALDTSGYPWRLGLATSSTGQFGPWTKYAGNPLSTLQYGTGAYGHACVPYIDANGLMHLWYHAQLGNNYQTGFAHATSTDGVTWTKDTYSVLAPRDATTEATNIGNPQVMIDTDGTLKLWLTQNGTSSKINFASFTGTLAQLLATVTAPSGTVGSVVTR